MERRRRTFGPPLESALATAMLGTRSGLPIMMKLPAGCGRNPRGSGPCRRSRGRAPCSPPAGARWKLLGFHDREDVSGRVLEPGDGGTAAAAGDALVVGLDARLVIDLEAHAALLQARHGGLDVLDRDVEDGERRRGVIGLGIDERLAAARELQLQTLGFFRDLQAQGLAVEFLCLPDVAHREATEYLRILEH